MSLAKVPVNLITGFLGVGKTTAIRHLLASKPADQFWAVLVNEFGEVGIDGAAISSAADKLNVVEVPGGCICCTTSPMLRVSITKLLRERRPDRLLIEPSGLGHPAGIIDVLRDPFLSAALDLRATITLVDPRHLDDSRYTTHDIWRDQIMLADVLIANKAERADANQIDRFMAMAKAMFPPKLAVLTTSQGVFDRAVLDLIAETRGTTASKDRGALPLARLAHPRQSSATLSAANAQRNAEDDAAIAQREPMVKDHIEAKQASRGWQWLAERRFSADRLAALFQHLSESDTWHLPRIQRAKAVCHTDHGWLLFNWVDGEASAIEIAWRRDSRVEVIVAGNTADWQQFEQALFACQLVE